MFVEMEIENLSNDLKVIYQESLNLMSAIISARSKLKTIMELQSFEKNGPLNDDMQADHLSKYFREAIGVDKVD